MLETAQLRAASNRKSAQVIALKHGAFLWLRTWLSDSPFVLLAGREVPLEVGASLDGPTRILCIAPGEWLIVSHKNTHAIVRAYLEPNIPKDGFVLVNASDGLASLEVLGGGAREMLSKGCGLDLHPRIFQIGRCARTRLAQIPVVIECVGDLSQFQLHVARSYVHYLHSWLADAAAEFGNLHA